MINGRPLTYISSDSRDMEPLTPNHLLLGCSQMFLPPGEFQEREINSRRRWRQAQVIADHFWKRWRQEYIPTLMKRNRWLQDPANLRVGQVVLIVDPAAPRGYWPLARITKIFPGQDGRVRSVEVQSAAGGVYQRPVTKLCCLEECPWRCTAGASSSGRYFTWEKDRQIVGGGCEIECWFPRVEVLNLKQCVNLSSFCCWLLKTRSEKEKWEYVDRAKGRKNRKEEKEQRKLSKKSKRKRAKTEKTNETIRNETIRNDNETIRNDYFNATPETENCS